MPSRGIAISAYNPAFSKGAKIYGANIQSGVVTSAHLADLGIVGGEIAAGAVTSAKLGTDAVVAVKIGAGAVTSAKIGTGAVTNAKIAAAAVTSAKLGTGAVVNAALSAKSVTSAKMRAAFLSGSLVSGKKVFAVAHGLAVRPKSVIACAINTLTEASAAQNNHVSVAVSAATSTNIYLIASGTQNTAHKYAAYVQL